MILLELTDNEALELYRAVNKDRSLKLEQKKDFAERDRMVATYDCILNKINEASKPEAKEDVLITNKDLFFLISSAKEKYLQLPLNLQVSGKDVEENYYVHIALANALIMWLNGKSLLKRLAKFDFTDQSSQYEVTEE